MIYNFGNEVDVPQVDLLTFLFESRHCAAQESTPLHADADNAATTYTKADSRVIAQQVAHFLRENYGIGKKRTGDDIVVSFCNGQAALPFLFYSIVGAQGIYSAASTYLSAEELASQIADGPGKLLVCSEDVKDTAVAAATVVGLPLRNVLVLTTSPTPALTSVDNSPSWSFAASQNTLSWPVITDPSLLASTTICLVYTSGTTGQPKGVRISHANMVSEAFLPAYINRPVWDQWAVEGKPFQSRTLAHLGCAHISGVQGYFVNPFYDGGLVYWMPKFDMMDFLKHNATLQITTFFSLPRVYAAVAFLPSITDQLKSLRIAYSGGWPLDPRVYHTQKLGGEGDMMALLSQTWGATETTGASTHMPPSRRDTTGSVGGLLPNMLMRLVDEEGKDVPAAQQGEAWLMGPIITQGYHKNAEADRKAFHKGWYRTGDLVEIKDDLIYVKGRVKEIIRVQGQYVPPAELEGIIVQYPGVTDAAVLGVALQDEDGAESQVPQALVVMRPGTETTDDTPRLIQQFVSDRVQEHQQLRGVKFVDALPRHISGKLMRDKLPELL
ncbi:putative acyl-coenzyme A synthetase-like protein [Emericellopsis cladophorae]|uniref:Acyl-coenzyme A synthetase-like protein n=1 Tax=Emericellopsis cladophorae TaxID=2686198 RepID=A0A9Q0B9A2_9HYPO|nr:putative acyl-coenzyme A synthetase-like protein [Emericellopsis cladophorae]KAI6778367.1 putative acyl-coenzyme A synthetase-like protein [Emericellopsis cladophorae]